MADREVEASVLTQIYERFARVEERLARLEERMDAFTQRFDDLSGEVRALRVRVDTMLLAMVGIIATLAIKL
jgi:hypothetical protein